jgi:hypothetical protein
MTKNNDSTNDVRTIYLQVIECLTVSSERVQAHTHVIQRRPDVDVLVRIGVDAAETNVESHVIAVERKTRLVR